MAEFERSGDKLHHEGTNSSINGASTEKGSCPEIAWTAVKESDYIIQDFHPDLNPIKYLL